MKKSVIWIIVIIVVILAIVLLSGARNELSPNEEDGTNLIDRSGNESESTEEETVDEMSDIVSFEVGGFEFGYSLDEIKVKEGETVKIVFTNTGEMPHDFVLDEFDGARTKVLQPGEEETIEFVADKVGTFEYYCSVGSHREKGMVGNLIVE